MILTTNVKYRLNHYLILTIVAPLAAAAAAAAAAKKTQTGNALFDGWAKSTSF